MIRPSSALSKCISYCREGSKLVGITLTNWSHLSSWLAASASQDTKAQALSLLTKIIVVESKVSLSLEMLIFDEVFAN